MALLTDNTIVLYGPDKLESPDFYTPLIVKDGALISKNFDSANSQPNLSEPTFIPLGITRDASGGTTFDSIDQQNNSFHRGIHVVLNLTAVPGGSETLTLRINGIDGFNNSYTLLESDPLTDTGINVLKLYPGIATIPNAAASDVLPGIFSVTTELSGGTWFYTLTGMLLR